MVQGLEGLQLQSYSELSGRGCVGKAIGAKKGKHKDLPVYTIFLVLVLDGLNLMAND
jgi:hypothetical protein